VNIKEYISSGIVESYVLGLASEQDRIEFEQLCSIYPEVVTARNEFEEELEKKAFGEILIPPASLKEKILNNIRDQVSSEKETKIISMETRTRSDSWLRYVAAASVILLLACAYFTYDFYSENKELKKTYSQLKSHVDSLNDQMAFEHKMMSDPNISVVNLTGTQKAPASSAHIYWDTTSSNVYLVVKNMPQLPSNKQYQLWALLNGQPKDLGLFDIDKGKVMLKMKDVQKADAFAITIENRGNTGGPTLEELQTMGKTRL
jgi:anti-sigma-K factor RskA